MKRYDFLIIGSGPAGQKAAIQKAPSVGCGSSLPDSARVDWRAHLETDAPAGAGFQSDGLAAETLPLMDRSPAALAGAAVVLGGSRTDRP